MNVALSQTLCMRQLLRFCFEENGCGAHCLVGDEQRPNWCFLAVFRVPSLGRYQPSNKERKQGNWRNQQIKSNPAVLCWSFISCIQLEVHGSFLVKPVWISCFLHDSCINRLNHCRANYQLTHYDRNNARGKDFGRRQYQYRGIPWYGFSYIWCNDLCWGLGSDSQWCGQQTSRQSVTNSRRRHRYMVATGQGRLHVNVLGKRDGN